MHLKGECEHVFYRDSERDFSVTLKFLENERFC